MNESWSACELLRNQDPESPEGSRIIFLTLIFSANPSHVQNTRREGEIVRRRMRGSDDEEDEEKDDDANDEETAKDEADDDGEDNEDEEPL